MSTLLIIVFVLGYVAIAFEHTIGVNKAGAALITGVLCWTVLAVFAHGADLSETLTHHLGGIAGIAFFLLGAMTIVELIAANDGFELITERITETRRVPLLWTIALLAFFLSAILDNLTTTIVMVTLTRKLFNEQRDRLYFASAVVIAANAGGAWSPIGDVTTTMLWIGGQISARGVILSTFVPSLAAAVLPLWALSFRFDGRIMRTVPAATNTGTVRASPHRRTMLLLGIGTLLFVPVFKTLTHLPPYMGMFIGLGVMWVVTAIVNRDKNGEERKALSITSALERTDTPSLLFFVGILLSVAALQQAGVLIHMAEWLMRTLHLSSLIAFSMGLLSAVIDNVPLVAAVQGMFTLDQFPTDHSFWSFLAYCAGTGGSALIIGSAAGVVAMGIERITFFWYLKRISAYALLGYVAGAGTYVLQELLVQR
ncbi:MAG: sodium:proton antiporter NhaD [Flavobacteriales bacterium]